MNKIGLTINGCSVMGEMPSMNVLNPANETVAFNAPVASIAQLNTAVEASKNAFKSWTTPLVVR